MGIKSVNIISVNVSPQCSGKKGRRLPVAARAPIGGGTSASERLAIMLRAQYRLSSSPGFTAFKLSMTMIMGLAFPAAIRLSRMKPTRPCLAQPASSSPHPLTREIPLLAHFAMGHILWRVEVRIRRWNFDSAVLPPRAKKCPRCRIRHNRSIHDDAVVMEANRLRRNGDGPKAVWPTRHIMSAAQAYLDFLRIRCGYAEGYTAVRVNAGIRSARNIE